MKASHLVPLALTALWLTACDFNSPKDYNPKADFQNFLKKQEEAKKAAAAAASSGAAPAVAEVPGKKTYETYCVACHGIDGKADGAGALAMNPRPRALVDKDWQAKVTDEHIYKVIKEGGAAVGLSATMAPWGAAIADDEIKNVVQYVRHFGK
jgi:mono/diheme cytochrome c family protein